MDDKGLSMTTLLDGVAEGLKATEAITIKDTIYKEGRISKKTEKLAFSPDFKTRHKYIETALKLRGLLAVKPPEIIIVPTASTHNTNNTLNLFAKKDMLDDFLKHVEEKTSQQLLENARTKEVSHA